MTGFQLERERLVDLNKQRLDAIEKKADQVDEVLHKVNSIELRMTSLTTQFDHIREDIRTQRNDQKDQMKEIIELIKKGNK